jgi:hypothetical protein
MRLLIAGLQVRVLPAELKKRQHNVTVLLPFSFLHGFPAESVRTAKVVFDRVQPGGIQMHRNMFSLACTCNFFILRKCCGLKKTVLLLDYKHEYTGH